jgi:hypothetical protein
MASTTHATTPKPDMGSACNEFRRATLTSFAPPPGLILTNAISSSITCQLIMLLRLITSFIIRKNCARAGAMTLPDQLPPTAHPETPRSLTPLTDFLEPLETTGHDL